MTLTKRELAEAVAHLERGDWQAAHAIVQKDEDSPLACWAHGIVHLMEGDVSNARYWYARAKQPFTDPAGPAEQIKLLKKELRP